MKGPVRDVVSIEEGLGRDRRTRTSVVTESMSAAAFDNDLISCQSLEDTEMVNFWKLRSRKICSSPETARENDHEKHDSESRLVAGADADRCKDSQENIERVHERRE
jgi:hypothetical protein